MSSKPIAWKKSRIEISPFAKSRSVAEATKLAKQKEKEYKAGKKIGFTYVSSLKSMGRIPRASGQYVLGDKYKNV